MITSATRVLFFAPHPDDESLAAGGTLRRLAQSGVSVDVVYVTDGEFNHWPQRYLERRWAIRGDDRRRWGAMRREEARAALTRLGIPAERAHFLGLPDNQLMAMLRRSQGEFSDRLTGMIDQLQPQLVIGPSVDDLHPDHQAVGFVLDSYREGDQPCSFSQLRYLTHGRTRRDPAVKIELSPEELRAKRSAILCHETQMALSKKRFLGYLQPTERFHSPDGVSQPKFQTIRRIREIFFPQSH